MSDLGDLIKGAGDAHAAALDARRDDRGNRDDVATSVVVSIRRRRAFRAGATGLVAAVGVGALAVTAVAALGPDEQIPAVPAITGAGDRCDLDTYPIPNLAAIPESGFKGRLYADFDTDTYMYRTAEGSLRQLEEDEDGRWRDPETGIPFDDLEEYGPEGFFEIGIDRLVFDVRSGGMNLQADPTEQYFEWTTVVPPEAPEGVSMYQLVQAHEAPLLHGGMGISPTLAGDDAVVEQIVTRTDGSQETERVLFGHVPRGFADPESVASFATRVTLPSGESVAVTTTRDPAQVFDAFCGENTSRWQNELEEQQAAARASFEAQPERGFLDGLESDVFACGAPLDPALEGEVVSRERRVGIVWNEEDQYQTDYGQGATVLGIAGLAQRWNEFEAYDGYLSAGWGGSWSEDDDGTVTNGSHDFLLPAFIDDDGVIVGYADPRSEQGTFYVHGAWGSVPTRVFVYDEAERFACADVPVRDLEEAMPVVLTGIGPTVDDMDWAWFRVEG
ncbi:hypothetical protein [Demequina zhanjiangensis]|uniref:Uncharacterized protein n=1 Tax=Demequina zhanjiangensis TaxID=3051659 RepID=A0ABT8FX04_9MICO|nr:hypothetical protein [Demequina sp. SYSU T00b26]MDN4471419.1 hypothetical protein [Demequina sp. SYSU T00b26]